MNVGNVMKRKLYVLEHYCDQNQSYSAYNNNTENKSVFISIFTFLKYTYVVVFPTTMGAEYLTGKGK